MAFTFRNAKNINVDSLFNIQKAYAYSYSDAIFPHYKKSKIIVTFPPMQEQTQDEPQYYYYGYVTENNNPISRKVNLYNRNTGELMGTTTSSGSNGYYYLTTTISGEHFIVAFDDEAGEDYNALILDKLLSRGIE